MRKLYRWRFTGDIAAQFVPRLERKGYLRKEAETRDGTVWVVQYTLPKEAESKSILGALKSIIDDFEGFPPRVTDLLSYDRTREQLEDILIRFLVSMDSVGEGAYSPELGELDPGGSTTDLLSQLEEGGRPLEPDDRYMCARFVRHIIKEKPEVVTHLVRLASIALLTEVVEDFLKPVQVADKSDLTILLDAPIALDYLGCSGYALKDDIQTVILSLQAIGVKVIVLPASCAEMQRNLRSMLALTPNQRHGYTHNALIRREIDIDFVKAVSNNPERALEAKGITVRPLSLDSFPHSHRFFSEEQYEDFLSSIHWGNFVPAREHDATCAALVMRLREGQHSSDLFKCRYAMVSRNPSFARHARKYCVQNRMLSEIQEGPVVYQRELATAAWLRTGLGADESIPRGHLIATCERVLQVRPEVRNALASQLARITPERLEQLNVLMQDSRSMQKLADETLNNENVVTAENAEHLLKVMREATASELQEKYDAQLAAEKRAYEDQIERDQKQMASMQETLDSYNQKELELKEHNDRMLDGLIKGVNQRARIVEFSTLGAMLLVAVAGAINYFSGLFATSTIWNIFLLVLGVVSLIRLAYGVLERPMPGLVTLLNLYTRSSTQRQITRLGLQAYATRAALEYKGGRVTRGEQT